MKPGLAAQNEFGPGVRPLDRLCPRENSVAIGFLGKFGARLTALDFARASFDWGA